jgi:hypothetical protein
MDPLLEHPAVTINQKDRRVGDAPLVIPHTPPKLGMMTVEVVIEHTQPLDGTTAVVREQRVRDAVFRAERTQRLHRIVADGKQRHPGRFEIPCNPLQLHELRFTVGSPAGAAIEYDERLSRVARPMEIDQRTVLIEQGDIRELLPNLRTP